VRCRCGTSADRAYPAGPAYSLSGNAQDRPSVSLAGIYLSEQTVTSLSDAGPPAGSVPVHLIVGGSEEKSRRSSP
jgi:hypothetical protein